MPIAFTPPSTRPYRVYLRPRSRTPSQVWICICEIALFRHNVAIKRAYESHTAKLGAGKLPPVFLFEDVSLSRMLSAFVPSKYIGVSMWGT
jgi:hypothetical protein